MLTLIQDHPPMVKYRPYTLKPKFFLIEIYKIILPITQGFHMALKGVFSNCNKRFFNAVLVATLAYLVQPSFYNKCVSEENEILLF